MNNDARTPLDPHAASPAGVSSSRAEVSAPLTDAPIAVAAPRLGAVFAAIWGKTVAFVRRYTFNTISQLFSIYLLFLVVFFGARGISGAVGGSPAALGETLDAAVVGFFLWFLALAAHSDLAFSIMNEARFGTLEQLMMTPVGFRWVGLFQVITGTIVAFVMSGVILGAMVLTTGRTLHIDVVTVLPLLLLVAATAIGIGYALGGLALIYKRIDALFQMMQFFFILLIAAPAAVPSLPLLTLLPMSLTSRLLNEAMTEGLRLSQLGGGRIALAVFSTALYFIGGLAVFSRLERKARDSGSLAQY